MRFRHSMVLVLSLWLPTAVMLAADANDLPDGTVEFGESRYLLIDEVEDLSWQKAHDRCAEWGGTLVVVSSAEEAAFVTELCDGRYAFLGATDRDQEGKWRWIDGTPWEYTNWMDGQPNDYDGGENYLATYDGGQWVDVAGSGSGFWMPTGFICEWAR